MVPRASRRQFFLQAAGATAALTAASWSRVHGANEKLRVASIGTGGKGWSDLTNVASSPHVEVAAICDIDESKNHLGRAAERFPRAARFTDWRRVLEQAKTFDAVIVSTPDHMHAPVALPAMQLNKHIYCQKPLTHTVHEARQMRRAAQKYRLVTQMGNQIQSHEAYRTAVKLVHDGLVGKIKEVHSWQGGKLIWFLVDERPAGSDPVPKTVHWDRWLGVAPERPYKARVYHPFNWRAWKDYSNGQLGDFGCHILDPVFQALKLTAPVQIRRGEVGFEHPELWTKRCVVHYEFPGTEHTAGRTLKLTWYDGEGSRPQREGLGVPGDVNLPQAGSVLVGEKGSLVIPHVAMPRLFLKDGGEAKFARESSRNHYVGWADACRGEGKATSSFDYSGPLTETVLLGTVAVRLPGTTLKWDAEALKTDSASANALLRKEYRKGWEPAWVS